MLEPNSVTPPTPAEPDRRGRGQLSLSTNSVWEELAARWERLHGDGSIDLERGVFGEALARYIDRCGPIDDPPLGAHPDTTPQFAVEPIWGALWDNINYMALAVNGASQAVGPHRVKWSPAEKREILWQERQFCAAFGIKRIVRPWV